MLLDARIDSKNTNEPWSYKFNYKLTSHIYNSKKITAKIARYTLIPLAFSAAAETIREVIKFFFKLLGNLFRLYKFSILKSQKTEERSTDEIIQNLKSIEHIQIIPTWKKALHLSVVFVGLGSIIYVGYSYFSNLYKKV